MTPCLPICNIRITICNKNLLHDYAEYTILPAVEEIIDAQRMTIINIHFQHSYNDRGDPPLVVGKFSNLKGYELTGIGEVQLI